METQFAKQLAHGANMLPELVKELEWLQDAMSRLDPLLDVLRQPGKKMICRQAQQHIAAALAAAEEVN